MISSLLALRSELAGRSEQFGYLYSCFPFVKAPENTFEFSEISRSFYVFSWISQMQSHRPCPRSDRPVLWRADLSNLAKWQKASPFGEAFYFTAEFFPKECFRYKPGSVSRSPITAPYSYHLSWPRIAAKLRQPTRQN